jgi:hypothetical protein
MGEPELDWEIGDELLDAFEREHWANRKARRRRSEEFTEWLRRYRFQNAIAFDATTGTTLVQTGVASGTNDTTTITVGASATIFMCAIEASLQGGNSDASITFPTFTLGGNALTQVPSARDHSGGGTSGFVDLYYLQTPPTGSQTLSVTMNHSGSPSTVGNFMAVGNSYTGALAGTFLGTAKTNHAGGSSGSVTDTLATGDIFPAAAVNGSTLPTVTTGTSRNSITGDGSTASHAGLRLADNTGTGSISVTFGLNGADSSAICGVKLIAATASGKGIVAPSSRIRRALMRAA